LRRLEKGPAAVEQPGRVGTIELPKAARKSLHPEPGQRFLVRATESRIELVPCDPLSELQGFFGGADTRMDDIRDRDERI
jgi:hypothetical protein